MSTGTNSPITFVTGTSHVRIMGEEITRTSGTGLMQEMIGVGAVGGVDHIILDRSWCHGTYPDRDDQNYLSDTII